MTENVYINWKLEFYTKRLDINIWLVKGMAIKTDHWKVKDFAQLGGNNPPPDHLFIQMHRKMPGSLLIETSNIDVHLNNWIKGTYRITGLIQIILTLCLNIKIGFYLLFCTNLCADQLLNTVTHMNSLLGELKEGQNWRNHQAGRGFGMYIFLLWSTYKCRYVVIKSMIIYALHIFSLSTTISSGDKFKIFLTRCWINIQNSFIQRTVKDTNNLQYETKN